MVLFTLGPAVVGIAAMRRKIVEKLVGMAERKIVLPGAADPKRTGLLD